MSRILFQRAITGYRAVRGELINRVQSGLKASGADPGDLDGIYGDDTENALKTFEARNGLPVDGKITDDIWVKLVGALPNILDRCLQLTGDFENHGFEKVAGNFDDAGLTWGIIGYTLRHGEVQKILTQVLQTCPALIDQAFGSLKDDLIRVLQQNLKEQLAWADSVSIGPSKYKVEEPWEDAFKKLGAFVEVQALQLSEVKKYWEIAIRDAKRFRLTTEMGIGLCFDIAVQNGGVDFDVEGDRIELWLNDHPNASEQDRRVLIADVVAENSRPQYVEDVRRRKRTIALGSGQVHGSRYSTQDWGISEYPWEA